jgi:hypothetical protein
LSKPGVVNVAAKVARFDAPMPETRNKKQERNSQCEDAIPPRVQKILEWRGRDFSTES